MNTDSELSETFELQHQKHSQAYCQYVENAFDAVTKETWCFPASKSALSAAESCEICGLAKSYAGQSNSVFYPALCVVSKDNVQKVCFLCSLYPENKKKPLARQGAFLYRFSNRSRPNITLTRSSSMLRAGSGRENRRGAGTVYKGHESITAWCHWSRFPLSPVDRQASH